MTISVPESAITDGPHVLWTHVDGPFMTWAGHSHWLTWRERLSIWLGRQTVDQIACRRWPHLAIKRDRLRMRARHEALSRREWAGTFSS